MFNKQDLYKGELIVAAIRYSGNVRARVTLTADHNTTSDYRVCARIVAKTAQDFGKAFVCTVAMNVEHGRGYGTDSPRAFDEAAECGLRLLSAEHSSLLVALGFDGEAAIKVTRQPVVMPELAELKTTGRTSCTTNEPAQILPPEPQPL